MIMFILGLTNSILSFLTFQNKELRIVGCGMYLLASSITSFLTICMFTVKFWFLVLTHMNVAFISSSILRGGCIVIEFMLKFCLYLDTWFNACVAIERAVSVFKGISFNKKRSRRIARWIILILPICIIATLIHEPIYRRLVEHNELYGKSYRYKRERYFWCVNRYPPSVENYNTATLVLHLLGPFIANLLSAAVIIFGTAHQRSNVQKKKPYRQYLREQLHAHKQLLISPIILVILALPRLIMSILSGCLNVSNFRWFFLGVYFISYIPAILVFVVFVLPSKLYRKNFIETFRRCRQSNSH